MRRSGPRRFKADTLGVNPGERWDAIIDCDRPGVWPIHCHVLPNDDGAGRDVRHGDRAGDPGARRDLIGRPARETGAGYFV